MAERDEETRTRLLSAAAHLFAERGAARVTVRDICGRAHANVAAVNYHFGGKHGLYTAVMQSAVATMQATTDAARAAGDGQPAEARLRAYVGVFVARLMGSGRDTWIHQLMMREIADPTPALDMVVEQVLQPRMHVLCSIIGEIAGHPSQDPRVVRCALSVQAQFHALLWSPLPPHRSGDQQPSSDHIDALADHITQFSLGGVAAFRG